jgi:tagaturonate reductase
MTKPILNKDYLQNKSLLNLPEKVLQFGTGVLLRGLCDYYIDKANRQGIFNGRIVVVKSTDSGNADAFATQDNLYTLCVRGLDKGKAVEEDIICSAISRTISAKNDWNEILKCSQSADIQIVISNTTEVGLQYVEESIFQNPPTSYPAKLLACMYERFKHFGGSAESGWVIIPTELLVDNGKILKDIVLKLAKFNKLEEEFINWIDKKNSFCSSLVDRIVPGKPKGIALAEIEEKLGYQDELLAFTEVYSLWAIEGNSAIKEKLSFAEADAGVVIKPNIEIYRELKLRLLNGTHTLLCGMAYLSDFQIVKEVFEDETIEKFINILMLTEIAPSIPCQVDAKVAERYSRAVLDRFRNPYLEHQLLSITLQYTMKMRMRCIPLLLNYYKEFKTTPQYFARGFAAYLLFMKAITVENGKYFGERNGKSYPIQCDSAGYFYEVWQNNSLENVVHEVLSNEQLWGTDLSILKGFEENILTHLGNMMMIGVKEVISTLNVYA